jgi:hypothetical protein
MDERWYKVTIGYNPIVTQAAVSIEQPISTEIDGSSTWSGAWARVIVDQFRHLALETRVVDIVDL